MKIWLTTDTHFNHPKLIEYGRPSDYEQRIQESHSQLTSDEVLIHLGDVALKKPEDAHDRFIKFWKCRKFLVLGNHDCRSYNFYLDNYWDFASDNFMIKKFGLNILFSHFPIPDVGQFDINIHGHFHDDDHRRKEYEHMYTNKHCLLSLEQTGYKPILLESLIKQWQEKNQQKPN